MTLLARVMYGLVSLASRKGLAEPGGGSDRQVSRQTGIRGETFAYWYLRRQGYTLIARNYTAPGLKGEIDLVGYDGPVLAFVEVKTRTPGLAKPEDAVTIEKRRNVGRMARRFLSERRLRDAQVRFDVVAIESAPGRRPDVRLHKNAYSPHQ